MPEKHRIIIAPNAPRNATPVATKLRRDGFQVDVAADYGQLTALLAEQPSLILLASRFDFGGRSPTEFLRQLRGDPRLRRVPAIVLSDEDDPEERIAAYRGGADAYLVAPVSARELVLRVRAILRRSSAA